MSADNGDMKRCEYTERDRPKCAHYERHHSDAKLCRWQQIDFGDVCTWDACFVTRERKKARGIGAYRVDSY